MFWFHRSLMAIASTLTLCQCVPNRGMLMGGPTAEERALQIANEPTGSFYYGRRYHVDKTRFWGYLRLPRQSSATAKLVMMREDRKQVPDRLPEEGQEGQKHGFDQNYEYRVWGYYTGRKAYDPNSNQILPEFMLTDYELLERKPGWLFSPEDRYHPKRVSLRPIQEGH